MILDELEREARSKPRRDAVIGLLVASFVIAAMLLVFGSVDTGQVTTGRIAAFEIGGRRGVQRMAVVRVEGRLARVRTPIVLDCQVGNEITLVRRRSLLGPKYGIARHPDPCRR